MSSFQAMKSVNIVVGRFQPLTKGHTACIEEAFKKKSLDTVLVMIDTPDDKVDKKHPFPSSLLEKIYKPLLGKDHILDIIKVKNADIVKIAEILKDKGYQIASWTCGTDRVKDYTRMSTNYKEKAGLADDFELLEVKRGDDDISATRVRQAISEDDFKTFCALTPFGDLKSFVTKKTESIFKDLQNCLKLTESQVDESITLAVAGAAAGAFLIGRVFKGLFRKANEKFVDKLDNTIDKLSQDLTPEEQNMMLAGLASKYAKSLPEGDQKDIQQLLSVALANIDKYGPAINTASECLKNLKDILPSPQAAAQWIRTAEGLMRKFGDVNSMVTLQQELQSIGNSNMTQYIKTGRELMNMISKF